MSGLIPPVEDFCDCNREAIVYVKYTGKSYCKTCHLEYLHGLWIGEIKLVDQVIK